MYTLSREMCDMSEGVVIYKAHIELHVEKLELLYLCVHV